MTIGVLEKALKHFIEEKLSDFKLPVPEKKGEDRNLKVFIGYLPPETAEEEIPAIAIRFSDCKNNEEERFFNINLMFVIYEKDTQKGYDNLKLIIQRVVDKTMEQLIIGDYFEVSAVNSFDIEDEQPYPFWRGSARLSFKAPKPSFNGYR